MAPPPAPDEVIEPGEPGPQPKLGPPGLAWGSQSNFTLDPPDSNTTST
jgi:hypothetical protein